MNNIGLKISMIICLLVTISCGNNSKHSSYINWESDAIIDGSETKVPFKESCGIKYVHVKVNGVGWDMIFDTGCSGTLLSLSEACYLAEKGLLLEQDILGMTHSQIADGSIVENMVVNLRQVSIITEDGSSIDCFNVKATISKNIEAPLLLGNEVLDEIAYDYTIDNTNKVILFNVK